VRSFQNDADLFREANVRLETEESNYRKATRNGWLFTSIRRERADVTEMSRYQECLIVQFVKLLEGSDGETNGRNLTNWKKFTMNYWICARESAKCRIGHTVTMLLDDWNALITP